MPQEIRPKGYYRDRLAAFAELRDDTGGHLARARLELEGSAYTWESEHIASLDDAPRLVNIDTVLACLFLALRARKRAYLPDTWELETLVEDFAREWYDD